MIPLPSLTERCASCGHAPHASPRGGGETHIVTEWCPACSAPPCLRYWPEWVAA